MRIKYSIGECEGCHLDKLITNKGRQLCQICDGKRKSALYRERRKKREKEGKKANKTEVAKFLKHYWETHPNRVCYETGEPLYFYKSWFVHHLVEKEDHPELALEEDNIVYLSQQQHSLWHDLAASERPRKMPKTWKKLQEIKKKYGI